MTELSNYKPVPAGYGFKKGDWVAVAILLNGPIGGEDEHLFQGMLRNTTGLIVCPEEMIGIKDRPIEAPCKALVLQEGIYYGTICDVLCVDSDLAFVRIVEDDGSSGHSLLGLDELERINE